MKRYYYTKEQLEAIAEEQIKKFDPERLEKPKDFDIYDFADLIGARYEWMYITPVQQILGAVFFDNCLWYSWPEPHFKEGMLPEPINIKKGTILIDRTVYESKDNGRENFIVAHECFHYLLHSECFDKNDGFANYCIKDTFEQNFGNAKAKTELDWIEYQASFCAAAFLMPRQAVIKAFLEEVGGKRFPDKPYPYRKWLAPHIRTLAMRFGVNYSPMLYRLQFLGLVSRQKDF